MQTIFQDFPHDINIKNSKVYKSTDDKKILELEFTLQSEIEYLGLSPKVFSFDGVQLVEEFIEGSQIAHWNDRIEYIPKLALALQKIHTHKISPHLKGLLKRELNSKGKYSAIAILEWMVQDLKTEIPEVQNIRKVLELFDKHLECFDYELSIIHGDLNPFNIIERGGEIYFIDWTDVRYDLASLDIVQLFYLNKFTKSEQNLFLENYCLAYFDELTHDAHTLLLCLYDVMKSNTNHELLITILKKYA